MSVAVLATLLAVQAPTTLLYQPKVGSSYKFAINSTIKNQRGQVNITATSNVKVLSHTGSYYRVETKLTDVKNGGQLVGGSLQASTAYLDYDKYGAMKIDRQSTGGAQPAVMGSFENQALGMQFPKKPVKVGDTWSNTVDLGAAFTSMMKEPGSKAVGKVTLNFKLVQLRAKDAVITCSLKGVINMDIVAVTKAGTKQMSKSVMSMVGKGQYTIERSSGVYMASNMTMDVATNTGTRSFSSNQSVSMKRL